MPASTAAIVSIIAGLIYLAWFLWAVTATPYVPPGATEDEQAVQ